MIEPQPGVCGDGNVDEGEQRDDGNLDPFGRLRPQPRDLLRSARSSTTATCQVCVGGFCIDAGERAATASSRARRECDDGNNDAGDGCDPTRQIEIPGAECGKRHPRGRRGVRRRQPGQRRRLRRWKLRDPGAGLRQRHPRGGRAGGTTATWTTATAVTLAARSSADAGSGNGVVENGETCDDGNLDAGDGWHAPVLVVEIPPAEWQRRGRCEACDDGNLTMATANPRASSRTTVKTACWSPARLK
ncbi:MAG: hypothetical protein R3F43_03480 [bacterium]